MGQLIVFNSVSLDGYFSGQNGDIAWAHAGPKDAEFDQFVNDNSKGEGALLFGRVTHDMMASWWPTAAAKHAMPEVAAGMNRMRKYVFSNSLTSSSWENTTIITGDVVAETRKLKEQSGASLAIFGSGSIIGPLVAAGIVDELQLVVCPVVLGKGRTMFEGVTQQLQYELLRTRSFKASGKVFSCYGPRR